MIKPIGPQYIAARQNHRVGLTHVSSVIRRLMKLYGIEEVEEPTQCDAAPEQDVLHESTSPAVDAPMPVPVGPTVSQETFSWFS